MDGDQFKPGDVVCGYFSGVFKIDSVSKQDGYAGRGPYLLHTGYKFNPKTNKWTKIKRTWGAGYTRFAKERLEIERKRLAEKLAQIDLQISLFS